MLTLALIPHALPRSLTRRPHFYCLSRFCQFDDFVLATKRCQMASKKQSPKKATTTRATLFFVPSCSTCTYTPRAGSGGGFVYGEPCHARGIIQTKPGQHLLPIRGNIPANTPEQSNAWRAWQHGTGRGARCFVSRGCRGACTIRPAFPVH